MRERGIVIDIKDGRALVEVTPAAGCGKNCSCSVVSGKPNLRRVELQAPEGVQPGALVTLEVSSGQVLASSAAVFLVPPVGFLAGALVSKPLFGAIGAGINPDLGMLICGAAGFLLGLFGTLLLTRRGSRLNWLKPRIVEVYNPAS